jgi:hypothetical protein
MKPYGKTRKFKDMRCPHHKNCWWDEVQDILKKRERQKAKKEIQKELEDLSFSKPTGK